MADRIVYLVDSFPSGDCEVELVDDARLAALMAEGFEVINTIEGRKIPAGRRTVKATMMILRPAGENRVLSVRQSEEGGSIVAVPDEFEGNRSVTLQEAMVRSNAALAHALANVGAPGHLGGASKHSHFPYVSGEMVGKAYDLGVMAAHANAPRSSNPFPEGSAPHMKWLDGWMGAQSVQELAESVAREIEKEGYQVAKRFGQDDHVFCPYSKGTSQQQAWLRGFKRGGGRVI